MNRVLFLLGSSVLTALGAFAQTAAQPQAPAQAPPQAAQTTATKGGMVFVDPATRKIRKPSASEIGATASAPAARAVTAPQAIHGPGAAVGVLVDDSKAKFMVATRHADGTISMECVTGPKEAEARVASSPKPTSTTSEMK